MRAFTHQRWLGFVAVAAAACGVVAAYVLQLDLQRLLSRPRPWASAARRLLACERVAEALLVAIGLAIACACAVWCCERRELRRERLRAQALQERLGASACHELRTPLTAIKGAVSLLESEQAGDRQALFVRMIGRNCDRLVDRLEALLKLADEDAPTEAV